MTRWCSRPEWSDPPSSSTPVRTRHGSTGASTASVITSIPVLVLSHLHADHIDGLAGVLDGRAVGAVAVGPQREPVRRLAGRPTGLPRRTASRLSICLLAQTSRSTG